MNRKEYEKKKCEAKFKKLTKYYRLTRSGKT